MKTLIVYSTKHGFTEECLTYLKDKLEGEVTLVNVNKTSKIKLNDFDWIIMGGSVYVAKMNQNLKQFAKRNESELLTKNIALFVCCMTRNDSDKFIQECFPEKIYKSARFKSNFGGRLQQNKLNFFERTITKIVAKQDDKNEETLHQNMDNLAKLINSHE